MNLSTVLRTSTMWLAILGMVLPTTTSAADPSGMAARTVIQDVALAPDGTLRGTVMGANGDQSSFTPVQFHQHGHFVAQAMTDANGHFVASQLTGGVYTVQTPGYAAHCRVWTNQAAPPSALGNLNLSGGEVIRGQFGPIPHVDGPNFGFGEHGPHGLHELLANPLLIGLGVAAAIAIPLAVNNSDRHSAS